MRKEDVPQEDISVDGKDGEEADALGPLVACGDRIGFRDSEGRFFPAADRFYAEAAEAWNRERFGEA